MNCPKCNAVNNLDARFCGSCGYGLQAAAQTNSNNELVGNKKVVSPVMAGNVSLYTTTHPNQPVTTQQEQQNTATEPLMQQNPNIIPQQPKKSNKTVFIILGVVIAIIAIVALVILLLSMNPSEEKQEKDKIDAIFNPEQLIKVKKNDKYGYINSDGKVEIEPIYEYANDFIGDYAVVRTEVETDGLTRTVYQIIDTKGKVKKQSNVEIEYIEETEAWVIDGELYNKSMKRISPDGVRVEHKEDNYFLWVNSKKNTGGIMNEKGKQVYTYNFESGESSIYVTVPSTDETQKDKYCIVNVSSKYGIVNCDTGVVVREISENYITSGTDNIFTIKDYNTYNFKELIYVQDDKVMYQTTNEEIDLYYYPGYVSIRDGSKPYSERYSYLHTATGEVKTERPTTTDNETKEEAINEWEKLTGNKEFSCSTGYGLMNDEKITLPCEWEDLEYLEINLYKYLKTHRKEYIYGEKDDKVFLIDLKQKKAIVEFNTTYLRKPNNTTFVHYTDSVSDTKKVYNLLTNKSANFDENRELTIYSNYITVKDSETGKLKYYNTDLEMIYEVDN